MAEPSDLLPGAEPVSHRGSPQGALVLHGFTGSPATMRPVVDALVAAGLSVEAPRLPGHGTRLDDMVPTRFDDWAAEAEAAYAALAGRCGSVAVVGLSMGGTLTCLLAARHPEIAGIVCVNPLVKPPDPELPRMVRDMLAAGETVAPGIGSDLADPEAQEIAYDGSPLAPLLSMLEAVEAMQPELPSISCPLLLMTSAEDHVVEPVNSDHLAGVVSGPVERVALERSYHVATLDHDRDLVAERTVAFVRTVTGA